MRFFLPIFLLLNVSLVQSGEISSPDKHWFYFEINNYMSPSYSLTLFENKFLFQEFYGEHKVPMNWCTVPFDLRKYKSLGNDLNVIGINDWNDYYFDQDVSDGTSYKLIVNIPSHSRHINGSNDFPKNFERLITIVNGLIKGAGCESSL